MRREPLGTERFVWVSDHHTFGTDAILLSWFAAARPGDRLVDLGTGCGIIPLWMFRGDRLASAVGVELSPEAVALCERSIAEQNLGDRFRVIEADLTALEKAFAPGEVTLVTCNPPYKAPQAGLTNPDAVLAAARHEIFCTLEDVVRVGASFLQSGGRFCLCHRPERLAELMACMRRYRVEPKRLRLVCQREGEEPWLVLVEGRRDGKTGLRIEPVLTVEKDGALSPEMRAVYGSYKEENA